MSDIILNLFRRKCLNWFENAHIIDDRPQYFKTQADLWRHKWRILLLNFKKKLKAYKIYDNIGPNLILFKLIDITTRYFPEAQESFM